jgi:hypothetical protein
LEDEAKMNRSAAIILLVVALLLMTLGTYFILFPRMADVNLGEANKSLVGASRLLQEMDMSDQGELISKMTSLAERQSLKNLLKEKQTAVRQAWLNKLRAEVAGLATAVRNVAPVKDFFVLDEKGVGLVRNIDLHWTGKPATNDSLTSDAIRDAGQGKRSALIALDNGNLVRAVVVPVFLNERVQAILYASFPLDDVLAKARSSELNLDVEFAYVSAGGISSGALSDKATVAVKDFLAINESQKDKLFSGQGIAPTTIQSQSTQWLAAGYPLKVKGSKGLCGIVVVRAVDVLQKPFGELALWLFGLGGACLVLLLVVVAIFGGGISRGLKQLEQDALEIAHGESQRIFKVEGPAPIRAIAELLNQIRSGSTPVTNDTGDASTEEEPEAAQEGESLDVEGKKESTAEIIAAASQAEEQEEAELEKQVAELTESLGPEEVAAGEEVVEGEAIEEEAAEEDIEGEAIEEGATAEEVAEEMPAEEEVAAEEVAEEMPAEEEIAEVKAVEEEAAEEKTVEEEIDEFDKQVTELTDALGPDDAGQEEAVVPPRMPIREVIDEEPPAPEAQAGPVEADVPEAEQVPQESTPEPDEEDPFLTTYNEFVKAKESIGEKVEKLNFDRFVKKLKKQEEILVAKHGCQAVRFQVVVRDNQVSLRPRIIK